MCHHMTMGGWDTGQAPGPPKSSVHLCVHSACSDHVLGTCLGHCCSTTPDYFHPSQSRRAHRLCHQPRWVEHFDNTESVHSVKLVACCGPRSTFSWFVQKYSSDMNTVKDLCIKYLKMWYLWMKADYQ